MTKLDITFRSNFDFDMDDVFTKTFFINEKSVKDMANVFTTIRANVKKDYRITKICWNDEELSVDTEGEHFGHLYRL